MTRDMILVAALIAFVPLLYMGALPALYEYVVRLVRGRGGRREEEE